MKPIVAGDSEDRKQSPTDVIFRQSCVSVWWSSVRKTPLLFHATTVRLSPLSQSSPSVRLFTAPISKAVGTGAPVSSHPILGQRRKRMGLRPAATGGRGVSHEPMERLSSRPQLGTDRRHRTGRRRESSSQRERLCGKSGPPKRVSRRRCHGGDSRPTRPVHRDLPVGSRVPGGGSMDVECRARPQSTQWARHSRPTRPKHQLQISELLSPPNSRSCAGRPTVLSMSFRGIDDAVGWTLPSSTPPHCRSTHRPPLHSQIDTDNPGLGH